MVSRREKARARVARQVCHNSFECAFPFWGEATAWGVGHFVVVILRTPVMYESSAEPRRNRPHYSSNGGGSGGSGREGS